MKTTAQIKAEAEYYPKPHWSMCRNCRHVAVVKGNYECHRHARHFRVASMATCRLFRPLTP